METLAEIIPFDRLETAYDSSTTSSKRPRKQYTINFKRILLMNVSLILTNKCFTKRAYFREGLLSRGLTLIQINYFCGFTLERAYYRGRSYNKVFTVIWGQIDKWNQVSFVGTMRASRNIAKPFLGDFTIWCPFYNTLEPTYHRNISKWPTISSSKETSM